jgi:D-alanyl-D-alanine carboxypeptidase
MTNGPGTARGRLLRCLRLSVLALLAALGVLQAPAHAQVGSARYSSIVIDAANGAILSAANPDELRFPASLTKMMTLYMVFEAVRDRRIALNQYVPISPNAASMSPTKLGLVPGSLITVEQSILGLVTKSANDAAAALGEMLGGDETRFAQMMTLRARSLGMTHSTFRNASGLPDWEQVTTAHDMAVLARRLIQDFPGYYHYFSTPSFVFAGRLVHNHQRLLQSYPGADGLKTGYIDASGFNVVTSALRSDTRLIGVVMGAASGGERDAHMASLLDQGFERMGVAPLIARRDPPSRMPGFISAAHAASVPLPASIRSRGARATAERQVADRGAVRRAADRPTTTAIKPPVLKTSVQPAPRTSSTRTAHGAASWRDPG